MSCCENAYAIHVMSISLSLCALPRMVRLYVSFSRARASVGVVSCVVVCRYDSIH